MKNYYLLLYSLISIYHLSILADLLISIRYQFSKYPSLLIYIIIIIIIIIFGSYRKPSNTN